MSAPLFSAAFRADLEALIRWRRDVRRFTAAPVDAALIEHLVALSTFSPSVGYSQPARFVRVDAPERRAAVIEAFERANADALAAYDGAKRAQYGALKLAGLREAPVHLAVFADTATPRGSGLGRLQMPQTLAYSAVTALQTFALAARAYDLGVGWISIIDPMRAQAIVDVDPAWLFIAYLCVGYPAEAHADRELARAGWESEDPRAGALLAR